MKFLFHLTTALVLAITAHGARSTSKSIVKGLGIYGDGYIDDGCTYTEVTFSADESVTKSTESLTPQTSAYVNVIISENCGNYSYTSTLFEIAAPNLKGSLTNGATVSVEGSQATSCVSWPEYLCEEFPTSFSLNVVLTPTGSFWKGHSKDQWSTPTTRVTYRYSGTTVDATLDFSGTLIDDEPFTPESSFGEIRKYTSGTRSFTQLY
jgi:hypothetical protein